MSDDLYDRDFYAWAKQQGAALRSRRFGDNVLEIDRVAEEIEDLADARYNKAESFTQRIVEHFYKLSAGGSPQPHRHWLVEVVNFRAGLERALTATVRNGLEDSLEKIHRGALKTAKKSIQFFEPEVQIDPTKRWSFEEIAGLSELDPVDVFAAQLPPHETIRTERPH